MPVFFLTHAAPTEISTLSLHDLFRSHPGRGQELRAAEGRSSRAADSAGRGKASDRRGRPHPGPHAARGGPPRARSEEHTSELQSHSDLVCRLLLEKKKTKSEHHTTPI